MLNGVHIWVFSNTESLNKRAPHFKSDFSDYPLYNVVVVNFWLLQNRSTDLLTFIYGCFLADPVPNLIEFSMIFQ